MIFLLRSIWIFSTAFAVNKPVNYKAEYNSPVDIPIILAGNFGELRPNHFHTGIDIKTNGKEGYNLCSIADGYVSRIKTSSNGYGKVLYVNHPEFGITSVYAHCQNFRGKIADYTVQAQFEAQFYEIDIEIPANALLVKRGEIIGLSGNSGSSTAPHLHFEIRETTTENPLNPLLFNFLQINDSRAPHLEQLVVYALSANGYRIPEKRITVPIKNDKGRYHIANDTIDIPAHFCSEHGGIGLGLSAHDKYNASENVCGIYKGILMLNQDTVHTQIMNRMDFEASRQINTHKDYEAYKKSRVKIDKYFRTTHNTLPIYEENIGNGILGLQPDHHYALTFSIADFVGNSSILAFIIRALPGVIREETTPYDQYHIDYLYPDSAYVFTSKKYAIKLGKNSFYEPVKRIVQEANGKLTFGNSADPVHSPFIIGLPIPELIKTHKNKIILYLKEGNKAFIGIEENNWYYAEVRNFGGFSLDIDTIAPELKAKFKKTTNPQSLKKLSWSIMDNMSGIKYYALFINGVYQLLEYEHKRNEVFASIVELEPGKHQIKIVARDKVGNERIIEDEIWVQ